MAQNLFSIEGGDAIAKYVVSDTLFAFDLDGTLAPIVADYSAATLDESVRISLKRLIKLVKVAIITGRSRKDAQAILGFEPNILIGNHGAEWPDGYGKVGLESSRSIFTWKEQLYEKFNGIDGIEIEFKGESISIHYRKVEDHEQIFNLIKTEVNKLSPAPKIIGGKYVVNLLPMDALTKGDALKSVMDILGVERAIYFGDDVTDEEVFRFKGLDFLGIHIGEDSYTSAAYYLKSQEELLGLINSMIGILELAEKNIKSRL